MLSLLPPVGSRLTERTPLAVPLTRSLRPIVAGALVVALVTLAAFLTLAILVSTPIGMALDHAALDWVQGAASSPVVLAMRWITLLGSEGILILLPLLVVGLWWRRLRWQAAELVLATGGAQVWNDVLKLTFQRQRPTAVASVIPGQAYSFPSGHAMVSIAFYGALAYIGWRVFGGWPRAVWITAMIGLTLVIGVSRLFLDVHYPTDVLASWAAGLFWLDISMVLNAALAARMSIDTVPRA
jgi:undecaprenyl-diphosphatase